MSVSKDYDKEISTAQSIVPALVAATATGAAVDLSGFDKIGVIVAAGVITDGTHTLKLQESDLSGSGFTDVAAGDQSGSLTALTSGAGGSANQEVAYMGSKRYIRVVSTVTGSPSTGGVYGAIVVRAGARTLPQ